MTPEQEIVDAAKNGDVRRVRELVAGNPLLAASRLTTGESALMAALYRGQRDVIGVLLGGGATPDLFEAAALGLLPELATGLSHSPATAFAHDGWTPLHLASFFGQREAAERLIDAGADIAAVSRNSLRNTALHAATAGHHDEVALLLIDRGAAVNVGDAGGHTPLHIAAENGMTTVVEALLAKGADPLAVDAEDKTPLARAAARGHAAVVDLINEPR